MSELPPGAVPLHPTAAKVLVAVTQLHERNKSVTTTEVASLVGVARSTAWHWIRVLDDAGVLSMPRGRCGAVHPLVTLA